MEVTNYKETPLEIIKRIAFEEGYTLEDMLAKTGHQTYYRRLPDKRRTQCKVRQRCFHELRHTKGLTNSDIGDIFSRDPSTVSYGVAQHEKYLQKHI